MAETSGFFDAEELTDGTFDREYIAEQWANYFKLFIGNGVFADPTNQLKVVAGEGLHLTVKEGWAFINGYWYHNDADLDIEVPVNSTPATVNSGIFVQFNSSTREVKAVLAVGRTEVDRTLPHFELKIAEVSVATGTTSITDAVITDTRMNEEVCGFVHGLLSVETTEDLFLQFEAQFMEWFDHMKDQLSEDAAGHLQEEIGDLSELETTDKTDLVSAINENKASTDTLEDSKQDKTDNTLSTVAKTIVGAINELLGKFTNYFTKSEINTTLGNYYTKTTSDGRYCYKPATGFGTPITTNIAARTQTLIQFSSVNGGFAKIVTVNGKKLIQLTQGGKFLLICRFSYIAISGGANTYLDSRVAITPTLGSAPSGEAVEHSRSVAGFQESTIPFMWGGNAGDYIEVKAYCDTTATVGGGLYMLKLS